MVVWKHYSGLWFFFIILASRKSVRKPSLVCLPKGKDILSLSISLSKFCTEVEHWWAFQQTQMEHFLRLGKRKQVNYSVELNRGTRKGWSCFFPTVNTLLYMPNITPSWRAAVCQKFPLLPNYLSSVLPQVQYLQHRLAVKEYFCI